MDQAPSMKCRLMHKLVVTLVTKMVHSLGKRPQMIVGSWSAASNSILHHSMHATSKGTTTTASFAILNLLDPWLMQCDAIKASIAVQIQVKTILA